MKKYQRGLMAATLALCSYVAIPAAYADVLNIPVSAALMNGDPLASGCQVGNGPYISSVVLGGICDFQIPLTVPTGHTIQQISVIYGDKNIGPALIYAGLSALNFVTPPDSMQFESMWGGPVPAGALQVKRLMAQTKYGAYPDAFVVQPNTMYQVVLHLDSGAIAAGLQVTYQ